MYRCAWTADGPNQAKLSQCCIHSFRGENLDVDLEREVMASVLNHSPSAARLRLERARRLDITVQLVEEATQEQRKDPALSKDQVGKQSDAESEKLKKISSSFVTKVMAEAIVQLPQR